MCFPFLFNNQIHKIMSRFNPTKTTGTTNLAGGMAYKESNEMQLVSLLLTSFGGDKFYEKSNDVFSRLDSLIASCDKLFCAKAIVYARTIFGMRTISHYAASVLAKYIGGETWAKDFYNKVIWRPDDITEIVACHLGRKQKLTNAMKKGFASVIESLDTYLLAKYKKSIIDIANLVHPNPMNSTATIVDAEGKTVKVLDALMHGITVTADTWEAAQSEAGQEVAKAVKEGKLTKDEAEKVRQSGGLFIIGTERHEARRIDNQLRGRSGRQGDPGESQFFLSLEDDLMRIFGGDRVTTMMDTLKVDENLPIQSKMLTNVIESSQKKIEGRNFNIRKNVLNYDDVMNKQREIIYGQRQQVLNGEDIHESITSMISEYVNNCVDMYLLDEDIHDNWNLDGLRERLAGIVTLENDFRFTTQELDEISKSDIADMLHKRAEEVYANREKELGKELLREIERVVLLKVVDTKWMAHIDDMDELKKGIGLRSYGQKNPVVEYRMEGFEMFDAMVDAIREDTVRMLFTIKVQKQEQAPKREQVLKPDAGSSQSITRKVKKIGPNEPCPCGSGKKYKKCCGANRNN